MNADPASIKGFLDARGQEIATAHRQGAESFATCAALTTTMDEAIQAAFGSLPAAAREHIAILPLGGYGRAELCPGSDIDVMVLRTSGTGREVAGEAATSFLHVLWDAGVDVGHSVRTVDEAMALRGTAVDAWTSMLESRYLCGNRSIAQEFFDRLPAALADGNGGWYIEGVLADVRSRHERYGNSVKLLEPNIKKSAGGLRDIQAAYWLQRSGDPSYLVENVPSVPATRSYLDTLRQRNVLDEEEHQAALAALKFLFRVRHEMHYQRNSQHDTLEYTLQMKVAESLGYGTMAELRSVEVFMHDYYLHARTIHSLYRQLTQRFRESVEPSRPASKARGSAGELFFLYEDAVSLAPGVDHFEDIRQVFEAFTLAAENDLELDGRLRAVLERSLDLMTDADRESPELASLFRRMMSSRRVASTLRAMNDMNLLGRYIPEFGELVAFFQHNVYHYFTADEHTLIAIAKAELLREQRGVLREVFRNLRRKDLLYMSLLLHDIAKPRGVADHEITGVAIARTVLDRLGMSDLFPDLGFLVRNHLLMEQIAFRRNIHDPDTIKEFAARFERAEQLDYLFVLTYADLSAVNPSVWTEWKSAMLQELYQRTSEVLRRNLQGEQIDAYHQQRHEAAMETMIEALSAALPREHVESHLQGIQSEAYLALFSEEEISQHIQKSLTGEAVSTLFSHSEGYTEVTVIARDAPFALSKFCAVLSANDANIFDATVFTRSDGIIIDRFRVTDAASKQQLESRVCTKIGEDLTKVVDGKLDIDHLFLEHRRKWKRRPKHPLNPSVRTDVQFEDSPRHTIIDVYAPDSVGFLYRVTESISRLGLDIYFAKIATRVDGILDAFYTLDRTGKPVTDLARREGIRSEILATIRSLAEQELT